MRGIRGNLAAGGCTMAELMALHEERLKVDPNLKPASIQARLVGLKKVRTTWPQIETLKPTSITPAAILEWANRFKTEGTAFTPPDAKTTIRGNSAGSVNRAIDSLRRVLDIAVEQGAIHSNPARAIPTTGRLKKRVVNTKPVLPSFADLQLLFTAIEANGAVGGWGAEAADFCRFLAYSGCRVGEMKNVTWGCVHWERGEIHIAGEKTESSNREVPPFADLLDLLGKLIGRRKLAARYTIEGKPRLYSKDRIFRLCECQKALDTACAKRKNRPNYSPRFSSSFRDSLHRMWSRYPDDFEVARPRRRQSTGDENVRAFARLT